MSTARLAAPSRQAIDNADCNARPRDRGRRDVGEYLDHLGEPDGDLSQAEF